MMRVCHDVCQRPVSLEFFRCAFQALRLVANSPPAHPGDEDHKREKENFHPVPFSGVRSPPEGLHIPAAPSRAAPRPVLPRPVLPRPVLPHPAAPRRAQLSRAMDQKRSMRRAALTLRAVKALVLGHFLPVFGADDALLRGGLFLIFGLFCLL